MNPKIGETSKPTTRKNKEKEKLILKRGREALHKKTNLHALTTRRVDMKTVADSGDETIVTSTGMKGKNFEAFTSNSAQSIDNEENERKRHEIFYIRVISKHQKIDTLFDSGL